MNKTDYVELGLACAEVCKALDRGMKGRQANELSQPVFEAIEQLTTSVKPTGYILCTTCLPCPNRRTIAEIQGRIIEKGQRGLFSRVAHAKSDKDTLASWRSDLNRILHVFNVRSASSVRQSLTTPPFKTELAINTNLVVSDTHVAVSDTHATVSNTHVVVSDTHAVVSDTHAMISDLHRNALTGQEGTDDQHRSVSPASYVQTTGHSPSSRLDPGQQPQIPCGP
jgi:hypothetical protein